MSDFDEAARELAAERAEHPYVPDYPRDPGAPTIFIPDDRFAEVAREIVRFSNARLEAGDLFDSNIVRTERIEMVFDNLLTQYKSCGFVTLDRNSLEVVADKVDNLRHVLSDRLGPDAIARNLGYDDAGIAQLRVEEEVLAPLAEITRQSMSQCRGMGR